MTLGKAGRDAIGPFFNVAFMIFKPSNRYVMSRARHAFNVLLLLCLGAHFASGEIWKFGLIADTQWGADDGRNPNGVAAGIITQVNAEFIRQGVKFVIAVGDLSDNSTPANALNARATYAQALYNAGIGFYPVRGNHDSTAAAASNFFRTFPQTRNGINNDTSSYLFIATDSANNHPGRKSGTAFQVGTGFSSPPNFPSLRGLTYGFSYNNATFVLLDQFRLSDNSSVPVGSQESWFDTVLSNRPSGTHGFVFGHRGLIHENHSDNLFGVFGADPSAENAFITSLVTSGVRYLWCGHDHIFNRSRVTATGGTPFLQEIILGSDSHKFYTPATTPIGGAREIPISQDRYAVGYHIVTVDEELVTVDYYGVPMGSGANLTTTPALAGNWTKRETFGYGLNGKEFVVTQGSSYSTVLDTFNGTRAALLGGRDTCTARDGGNRPFTQIVGTGWRNASTVPLQSISSNVLTLWGLGLLVGSPKTAPFALSLSYNAQTPTDSLAAGIICLLARDSIEGAWANAVDNNFGGKKNFVVRAWTSSDTLGSYGVDTASKRVWAVVNHGRDFAVANCGISFPPTLVSPLNGATDQPLSVSVLWNRVAAATSYRVQVSTRSDFSVTLINATLSDTFRTAALSRDSTYYWRVNATTGFGTSAWSAPFNFTTVPQAPSAPVLFLPPPGAINLPVSLTLVWRSAFAAASYRVQVSTRSDFSVASINETLNDTFRTVSLSNDSTYFWRVSATNAGGTGAWSSPFNFSTLQGAPSAPVLAFPAQGAANQPLSLSLVWNRVAAAALYRVQVSTRSDFSGISIDAVLSDTFRTVSLSNDSTYFWRVNATNAGGTGAWSSPFDFSTLQGAPSAPVLAFPAQGAANQPLSLSLVWNRVAAATSYRVQVSTRSDFSVASVNAALSDTFCPITLYNDSIYYWRVNATNAGGTGAWSAPFNFASIPPDPSVPVLVTPSNGVTNQPASLSLFWQRVPAASSYRVQLSTRGDFSVTAINESVSDTFRAVTLSNDSAYYWRVNATNAGGTSAWSVPFNFTVVAAAPSAPTLVFPSPGATNQPLGLSLVWNRVAAASSYRLQLSTRNDFSVTSINEVVGDTVGAVTLSSDSTYYWRVNATNAGGTGAWARDSFTTIPSAPSGVSLLFPAHAAKIATDSALFIWLKALPQVDRYSLKIATDSLMSDLVLVDSSVTDTVKVCANLRNGKKYWWSVSAHNSTGWSGSGDGRSFTVNVPIRTSIPVGHGWNLVSLNIHPLDATTSAVFGPLRGSVLVKNNAGQVYWPAFGINTIGTLRVGECYKVFTDTADTVRALGAPIDAGATPISLSAGWNMVAYLPQSDMSIVNALAGVTPQITIVKNNAGQVYWPDFSVNTIVTMKVGEGYKIHLKNAAILTYPSGGLAKRGGDARDQIFLPAPRHFSFSGATGNSAAILAKRITVNGTAAPDGGEIGAFSGTGQCVGAGVVMHGVTAFSVWGDNSRTNEKEGCEASKKMNFRLWNGTEEYPADFKSAAEPRYVEDGLFIGSFNVPDRYFITAFQLTKTYPNPFRRTVKIFFDIPTLNGADFQDIEIDIYSIRGDLVRHLVRGARGAGHQSVSWDGTDDQNAVLGSDLYIVQMRAHQFKKNLKLFKIK